jgi:very-short-patch-repair endonuclease
MYLGDFPASHKRNEHSLHGFGGYKMTPIEQLFWDAVGFLSAESELYVRTFRDGMTFADLADLNRMLGGATTPRMIFAPQVVHGRYRVDFGVYLRLGSLATAVLAVECDGHEFHSRTKEQAANDRSRDRSLLTNGIRVVRFTGSEIWRDPKACVEQAMAVIDADVDVVDPIKPAKAWCAL